jgi:hypothetical protein
MPNKNNLCGIECPICGNEDRFMISAKSVFTLVDDGTEDHSDVEYGDENMASCPECRFASIWRMFHKDQHRRMDYDAWDRMTVDNKLRYQEKFDIRPYPADLAPFVGDRVEVVDMSGHTRRFWVGVSQGWAPCYIELKQENSRAGGSADSRGYKSVKLVRRGHGRTT